MKKFTEEMKGHWFASSFAEWRTDTDMGKLVKFMKAGGFSFALIWVPLPADAHYEIDRYVPVVEGCVLVAEYKTKART